MNWSEFFVGLLVWDSWYPEKTYRVIKKFKTVLYLKEGYAPDWKTKFYPKHELIRWDRPHSVRFLNKRMEQDHNANRFDLR